MATAVTLYLWEGTLLYCGACGEDAEAQVNGGLAVEEDCCCASSSSSSSACAPPCVEGSSSGEPQCCDPCDEDRPGCSIMRPCDGGGCGEADPPEIHRWFETSEDASDAAEEEGYTYCGGDDQCCGPENRCYMVGCDEKSPHNEPPDDCKKWFWELCCVCCPEDPPHPDSCGDCVCDYPGPDAPNRCFVFMSSLRAWPTPEEAIEDAVAEGWSTGCVDEGDCHSGCYVITCENGSVEWIECGEYEYRWQAYACLCPFPYEQCADYPGLEPPPPTPEKPFPNFCLGGVGGQPGWETEGEARADAVAAGKVSCKDTEACGCYIVTCSNSPNTLEGGGPLDKRWNWKTCGFAECDGPLGWLAKGPTCPRRADMSICTVGALNGPFANSSAAAADAEASVGSPEDCGAGDCTSESCYEIDYCDDEWYWWLCSPS